MEENSPSLENQAQELNQKLTKLIKQRSLGYVFLTGILHSLGSVFGTVVVIGALGFIFSRVLATVDITKLAVDWVGQVMEQSVEKIVPTQPNIPEVNLDDLLNQINDLSGQE